VADRLLGGEESPGAQVGTDGCGVAPGGRCDALDDAVELSSVLLRRGGEVLGVAGELGGGLAEDERCVRVRFSSYGGGKYGDGGTADRADGDGVDGCADEVEGAEKRLRGIEIGVRARHADLDRAVVLVVEQQQLRGDCVGGGLVEAASQQDDALAQKSGLR